MFKSRSQPIRPSEITDESVWRARRRLLLQAPGALALAASLPGRAQAVPVGLVVHAFPALETGRYAHQRVRCHLLQ